MSGSPVGRACISKRDRDFYNGRGGTYSFHNPKGFYGNILLEVCLNNYISEAYLQRNLSWGYDQPRAFQDRRNGGTGRDDTVTYASFAVMYGGGPQSTKTIYRVPADADPGREKTGPKPKIIPIPQPNGKQRMFIDLNLGLRRVFFPVVHKWDVPNVDEYCMGVQINFAVANSLRKVKVTWLGRYYKYNYTLAFDPYDVIAYLTIPEDRRDPKVSIWSLMRLYEADNVLSPYNPIKGQKRHIYRHDGDFYSYATHFYLNVADFLSDENNIALIYAPVDNTNQVVKSVLSFIGTGLSYIPLFGPLASTSWHYVVEAIAYPDELKKFDWAEALQVAGTMTGSAVWESAGYLAPDAKKDLWNAAKGLLKDRRRVIRKLRTGRR